MNILAVDLKIQHATLKPEIDRAIQGVIDSASFVLGPGVEAFEEAFAAYHGVRHFVGVSNGTDALTLSLLAAGVEPGDEVITTPQTFGATLEAICHVGARPVLVDIDPVHYTLDPSGIEAVLTERTRAILPVHIYGHPVDMEPVMALARSHGLKVIEDCAQAHGARYRGQIVGTIGDAGCFSFYPGKNLGAYGDAGGVVTDDDDIADRLRMLRNHGQTMRGHKFYYHHIGYNNRMDGIQGAVLDVKLPHLDFWNAARQDRAARYTEKLADITHLALPRTAEWADHVYHLYVMETDGRDALQEALTRDGIASGAQYPFPVHLTPAYGYLGYRAGDLPHYEAACRRIISLPIYPEITHAQIDTVTKSIRRHFRSASAPDVNIEAGAAA